tara:strand:- start:293 stop:946 length:654 start_codon:yes stop_codon:yes gene_type:complete
MRDIMSLSKVLITGSSSGLGNHLALYFSEKGHEILLHGRNENNLIRIKNEINKNGSNAEYIVADLSNNEELELLCNKAKKSNIKMLINNAGIICPGLPLKELSYEDIESMIKVNLIAPIKIISNLNNILDHVININSMVGLEPKKNRSLYAASKWGLRGFSESLKQEDISYKILDVYPTNIKTWPERENAMELNFVLNSIYNAMLSGKKDLILDGRK